MQTWFLNPTKPSGNRLENLISNPFHPARAGTSKEGAAVKTWEPAIATQKNAAQIAQQCMNSHQHMAPLQMRLTMAARPCTAVRCPHYAERTGTVRAATYSAAAAASWSSLQPWHPLTTVQKVQMPACMSGDMKVAKHSIAIAGCAIAKG